jgi:hypothetical protein
MACGQINPKTPFNPERIAEEFFAMSQESRARRKSDSFAVKADYQRLSCANSTENILKAPDRDG